MFRRADDRAIENRLEHLAPFVGIPSRELVQLLEPRTGFGLETVNF